MNILKKRYWSFSTQKEDSCYTVKECLSSFNRAYKQAVNFHKRFSGRFKTDEFIVKYRKVYGNDINAGMYKIETCYTLKEATRISKLNKL
jgi:hypothetical protein